MLRFSVSFIDISGLPWPQFTEELDRLFRLPGMHSVNGGPGGLLAVIQIVRA